MEISKKKDSKPSIEKIILSPISKNSVSIERKLRVIDEKEETNFFKMQKLVKKTSTEEILNAFESKSPEINKKKHQLQNLIKSITSENHEEKAKTKKIPNSNKNNASWEILTIFK